MTELLFFLLWCGIIHGSFGTNYPSKSNMEVFDFRSPDVPKWSARTSEWNFQFVGTKASIVELARWYKGYYEANKPPLLAGSSRELDTLLGAYAVLWGTTQNPFFSQKYKELILNLSDREFFFSGLSVDPTVGNDFMTSYLWLREQGIFTEDEQKRIEAWMLKLKDAMQFPLQEANWGRLPQLAKALELHFPDEAKAIWKSIPKEGVSFDTRHRWENDAFAYDRIWLKHAYYYARTVRPELIGGANHRKAADWFLAQWTPNGMQPCYGDQTGASLWDANTPEWLAAHALKDGRLKWLAIKILQSALQNNQLREQGAQPALFQLWMNADDSLKPVKPEIGSVALRFPDGSGDKLVFRSGWEDDDAYLLLDLVGTRGHGHVDQNNAAFLLWRGKPWLIDSNYGIASTQEHNVLAIDTLQRAGISQVSVFRDFGPLAIGGAIASNYLSSGFDWERVVLFKNGGPIVIVDRVLAKESGKHDLSLLWHIKGELFHQEARAFSFKQGEESLHLLCSTDTIASQWTMARQDNVGTGCPPGSYELYWGQPCFQLSQPIPSKNWKPFGGRFGSTNNTAKQASWTNVFSDKVIETQTLQFIQEETHAGVISRSDKETSTVGVRFDFSAHRYGDIESDAKAFWAKSGMESQNFAWTDGRQILLFDLNVTFSAPVDAIISLGKRRGKCHVWATTDVHLNLTKPEGQFQADLQAGERSLTFELKPRGGEGGPRTGQR